MNLVRKPHGSFRRRFSAGYTLIELMIVVSIIGILSTVAIPKFSNLVRKSKEATTRASLGTVRSAITIYYSDTEGTYPTTLDVLVAGEKYLGKIPPAWTYEYGTQTGITYGP